MGGLARVSKFLRQLENTPSPFCNSEYGYLFLSLDFWIDWAILTAAMTLVGAEIFVGNPWAEPCTDPGADTLPAACEQTPAQTPAFQSFSLHLALNQTDICFALCEEVKKQWNISYLSVCL